MATEFLSEDFLLHSPAARALYHDHAAPMPIYDYHCHLSPAAIAEDARFDNLAQAWLHGDHYKYRTLRANGIDERFVTGDAPDEEKFANWAATLPVTLGSPQFHWAGLELKRYFAISGKLLNPATADEIYRTANDLLRTPEFSARNLMRKMNVALACTTDDPLDSLEHHQRLRDDGFEIKVYPTWRPDKAMTPESVAAQNFWIDRLERAADLDVRDYVDYLEALRRRHAYFHERGCRLSDHGMETVPVADYTEREVAAIFAKLRGGDQPGAAECLKFRSAMLVEFAMMNRERGWAQQLHIGALRNNNSRMFAALGPDTGYDSMGDWPLAQALACFLDRLAAREMLAPTIVYSLNAKDNEVISAMLGHFQGGGMPGKMQHGAAWWFNDQQDGLERHLTTVATIGLLGRFIGMLTDSRSFLSYPRHEYFRRILCNMLGGQIDRGELPGDLELVGGMVRDICFNNAKNYFAMQLD